MDEPLEVALAVIETLDELHIPYHVGGSFASSLHGIPRQTLNLDLVVQLGPGPVLLLVARLGDRFYSDTAMISRAIRRRGSFNLIHLSTGFKIDCFVAGEAAFDRSEISRAAPYRLAGAKKDILVKSPEDTLLRKLEWYDRGGRISDRQGNDVLGLARTQGDRLDRTYLEHWAGELGVSELIERALAPTDP